MSWLMVGNVVLGRGITFLLPVPIPGEPYSVAMGEAIGVVMVIGILLIDVMGLLYHRCRWKAACTENGGMIENRQKNYE